MIETFIKILGKQSVLQNQDVKDRYDHIWNMDQDLIAKAVLLPQTTEELSQIMKVCSEHNQKVVVHGGLTNLVGSTETQSDEVVISMEKFNKIIETDAGSRTMTVEAGVILEQIHTAAKEKDMLFPLNFGAKGSAQIGGCISSNAGGLRVLRFGMTRNLILGLEVVLADGTVLTSLKKILKDNSGYDLKQLFIGSEGTLGIVTKAVLRLQELPKSRNSAFIGINKFEDVIRFLKLSDRILSGALSGFELIWNDTYRCLTSPPSLLKPPMSYDYAFYVLIESLGAEQEKDKDKMQALLEEALGKEMIEDALLAYTESDLNWFWNIREDVGIIDTSLVVSQHFDVSIPIPSVGDYVTGVKNKLKSELGIEESYAFGHIADGNIHFIIGKENDSKDLKLAVDNIVYGPLQELKGSVSAEHGIGLHKKHKLYISKTEAELATMKTLKKALDPKCILNAGKIFD